MVCREAFPHSPLRTSKPRKRSKAKEEASKQTSKLTRKQLSTQAYTHTNTHSLTKQTMARWEGRWYLHNSWVTGKPSEPQGVSDATWIGHAGTDINASCLRLGASRTRISIQATMPVSSTKHVSCRSCSSLPDCEDMSKLDPCCLFQTRVGLVQLVNLPSGSHAAFVVNVSHWTRSIPRVSWLSLLPGQLRRARPMCSPHQALRALRVHVGYESCWSIGWD